MMLLKAFVGLLLVSASSSQESDEVTSSCNVAPEAQSSRCLIQRERPMAAALQTAGSLKSEDSDSSIVKATFTPEQATVAQRIPKSEDGKIPKALSLVEEKSTWTGDKITLDFVKDAPDLDNVTVQYREDWDWNGLNVTRKMKPYLQAMLPITSGQVVEDASKDGCRLYGFTTKTAGIASEVANRWWTAKPQTKDATTVYGIEVLNVPDIAKWEFSITYSKPPPLVLKVYPENNKVKRTKEGHLYVAFFCEDAEECADGAISIQQVQFDPLKEDMPTPEEVNATVSPNATLPVNITDSEDSEGLAAATGMKTDDEKEGKKDGKKGGKKGGKK